MGAGLKPGPYTRTRNGAGAAASTYSDWVLGVDGYTWMALATGESACEALARAARSS